MILGGENANYHLGISQRDANYYDYLNDPQTCEKIKRAIETFWKTYIHGKWASGGDCKQQILNFRYQCL